jgi:hypothetical protein
MATYYVGRTYTVWVEVQAESKAEAIDNALDIVYDFVDEHDSGAQMELNEYEDAIVVNSNMDVI